MSVNAEQFWELLGESGLLGPAEISRMRKAAAGKALDSGKALAAWLVSQLTISPFQGQILAAGKSGPFHYGDFSLERGIEGPGKSFLFAATHRPSRHSVRLDFLAPTAGESEVALARRVEGTQQHCQARHPGLTDCFLLEQLPDYKFLVLESPSGVSLEKLVEERGPVSIERAVYWVGQLALGLDVLHHAQLCHGRVHPGNIVIENDGARLIRNPLRHALPLKSPAVGHAPHWMLPYAYATPELSAWDRWPDSSADLYGLGCVLYFLITGQPPFVAHTSTEMIQQHMRFPPPSIASNAGANLDAVMQSLLAKSARTRCKSTTDLLHALTPHSPAQIVCHAAEPSDTFKAFFRAMQARQQHVEEEVTVRSTDPAYAHRAPEEMAPIVKSDDLLRSRLDGAESNAGAQWLIPFLGVGLAILLVYFGTVLFEPIDNILAVADVDTPISDLAKNADPSPRLKDEDGDTAIPVSHRYSVAVDDGKLLWAPLTDGQPHGFPYGQQGGQLFLAIRPIDILAQAEGRRVLQSLGPDFARLRAAWEKKYRVNLKQVERLIVVVSADAASRPVSVCDVFLKSPTKIPGSWTTGTVTESASGPIYASRSLSCLVPADENQQRFVVGPPALIEEIGDRGGQPPVLRSDFESLRKYSDADAQFTMLIAPSYLLRDGRRLVAPAYATLPNVMDNFFGDGVNAAMFSAHLQGPTAFAELRMSTTLEVQKPLQQQLPAKFSQLSSVVESYVADLKNLDDYWKQVAFRYGHMLQFLSNQLRIGMEDRQVVINATLPAVAAHNLVLATELSLAAGVSDAAPDSVAGSTLKTLEHVLIQKTSLSIPQQSLEFSMRDLMEDVNENIPGLPFPFKIEISGADLQLDGITRNQQIRDFQGENQRVGDLLTGLVMRANPITTVERPNEPDQKLVWVIHRTAEPKAEMEGKNQAEADATPPYVLITTRKAATNKGYRLPTVFREE